jgi:hypothetical protein
MHRQATSRGEPGWGNDLRRDGDGVGDGRRSDGGVGVPTAEAAVFRNFRPSVSLAGLLAASSRAAAGRKRMIRA